MNDTPEADAGDTTAAGGNGQQDASAEPSLLVAAQYIKDLSFEAPMTPGIYGMMQQQQPDIAINVDVQARQMPDNMFEVVLAIRAECKVGETVAFILELSYGGLFKINLPREQLEPMLLIECPRILFPFARYTVSDITRDGGFPPLMVGPVDFVSMYHQQLQQRQAATAEAAPKAD